MADSADSTPHTATTSLRHKTVRGMMWVAMQGVATRGVGMVQQLLLAWLLAPKDFGLIALALTVSTLVGLLSNPGIDSVLVQRQRRFRHWATPAFWLGMTTGLVGMVVTAIAAPVAAWAYRRPELVGLILVMATAAPLQTLQIIPRAKLQAELRFRTVVTLTTLGYVLTAVLAVVFAYFGFGAYSFAIPVPIVAGIMAAVAWRVVHPTIHRHPHFGRWKYLLGDSAALGGTRIVNTIVNQGDYFCLGLAGMSDESIGVYYFAFRLSTQSFSLLANVVPAVLFPSLSRLTLDPGLQVRSTMRATRLFALVSMPFCLLQILLARPAIELLCPSGWLDSVLPLQILTLGIMFNAPSWSAASLMMAQRRFRKLLWVSICYSIVFFALVVGALMIQRSIVTVALAVALWHFWGSSYVYWVALRPAVRWYGLYLEIIRPLFAGAISFVASVLAIALLPSGRLGDTATLVIATIIYCPVYVTLLRRLAVKDLRDLLTQIQPILDRVTGSAAW